jgi:nicotinate-nucleotide adenylyltransferase
MNLYLFGGSFDPPHLGHKEIIKYFVEDSDIFVLCPSYHSPLKESFPRASFEDRKKMLELMIEEKYREKFLIIDYESKKKSSFSVQTIKDLQKKFTKFKINMIIGADQYNKIELWKEYKYILDNVDLHVISRPGSVINKQSNGCHYIDKFSMDISSSYIRDNIKISKNIKKLLDIRVIKYILENKLYN